MVPVCAFRPVVWVGVNKAEYTIGKRRPVVLPKIQSQCMVQRPAQKFRRAVFFTGQKNRQRNAKPRGIGNGNPVFLLPVQEPVFLPLDVLYNRAAHGR